MTKELSRHILAIFLVCIIFSSYIVVAPGDPDPVGGDTIGSQAGAEVNRGLEQVGDFLLAVVGLPKNGSPAETLTYIFMGLVLLLFIYSVVESMGFFGKTGSQNTILSILVTIAITGLVMIALPREFFTAILPSYGAMGAAILTFIPFLMIFWFSIKTRSPLMARMVWIIYTLYHALYYVGLTLGTNAITQDLNNGNGLFNFFGGTGTGGIENAAIYPAIYTTFFGLMAVAGLLMNVFLIVIRARFYKDLTADERMKYAENMGLVTASEVAKVKEVGEVSDA